jgi:hypothetical protein
MKTAEILSEHFLKHSTFSYKGKQCIVTYITDDYRFFLEDVVSGEHHQNVHPKMFKYVVTSGYWKAKSYADEHLRTLRQDLLQDINKKVKVFNK